MWICPLSLVACDRVLCCSVVISEWMFELAAQLEAAKFGELLLLNYLQFDMLHTPLVI